MRKILAFISVICATAIIHAAKADPTPLSLTESLSLWELTSPTHDIKPFDTIQFNPMSGQDAPLARYNPNNNGTIELGQNIQQYRRDYIYLSSNQDRVYKPDFNQYLTVLTTLSLANELAHYQQDRNGSLNDFYSLYNNNLTNEACALYSLQQHISDIVMLEKAIRIENYFLSQNSIKGINALRIALEKNDLLDEYKMFHDDLKNQNQKDIENLFHALRNKRESANMSSLSFCPTNGSTILSQPIINRATEPATKVLAPYFSQKSLEIKQKIPLYNP
jgi:hypothetical protein